MYDVAIIGAGVIGAMTARLLAKYELKICIIEKENDVAMGATKANSAIVHAGFDAEVGSLKAILNVKGSQMMSKIADELSVKYINNGSLVIGFDEGDREILKNLLDRGNKNGVSGLRIIEREELKEKEPNIGDNVICALYAPTGAIICPYELTVAAIGNAMDNGADLKRNFEVAKIEKELNSYNIISKNSEIVTSKYIVNAAGLYSDEIAKMVGDESFSVRPRKGEYILLDRECGDLVSHTIFRTPGKGGKGILVSPTVDGNLILGPTSVDMKDKEDKTTSSDGYAKIIKEANENVKGLQLNKTITSFCGLRAVGDTGDFIINSNAERFINVAGIESPGLSASPAIASYILDMLWKMGLTIMEKYDYNPYRTSPHYFNEASEEKKNEIIKKDSRYGRILCRCESITEGEIAYAIRHNPKPLDLDGVKRRTRAQMGRCQGGFCLPYIIEMLAKEQNLPYEAVTKSGGKSYINIGKTKEAK